MSARLRRLFLARRQNLAAIAHELALLQREKLYGLLGYTSVAALAKAEHDMGKSKVSELIGISEGSRVLPKIRAAFDSGRLEWTKARELVKVATPETEDEWLRRAERSTSEELRAARNGEPIQRSRVLRFSPEDLAAFDQLLAAGRRELGAVDDGAVVLALLRRGASREGGEGPITRLVVTVCGECERASAETREGPVEVPAAVVAMARCDGEEHDLREEENVVSRAIPEKVRRRVLDRDGRRCRVPRCRSMSDLHIHHEDGWREGHDPERMVTVCGAHHRLRHDGELKIEGTGPGGFRFRLLDGTLLGAESRGGRELSRENTGGELGEQSIGPGEFSCENTGGERGEQSIGPGEFSCENTTPPEAASPQDVTAAAQALHRLGVPRREAKRRVQVALASGGVSLESLVRRALTAG